MTVVAGTSTPDREVRVGSRVFASVAFASFLGFSTLAMGYPYFADMRFPVVAGLTVGVYDLLMVAILFPALSAALSIASGGRGSGHPSQVRTMMALLLAYLGYQTLVVVPVGFLGEESSLAGVLRQVVLRYSILLVPLVYHAARDVRVAHLVAVLPRYAALLLVLWGGYMLVTGQGGFYTEGGDSRFRVLWGGSVLLFMWVLTDMLTTGPGKRVFFWSGVALFGLVLANHRSGYLAAGVGVVVAVIISKGVSRGLAKSLAAAGSVAAVALLAPGVGAGAFTYVLERFLDAVGGNGADRLMRWGLAVQFFLERPFNDFVWSRRYYLVDLSENYAPHNFVLEIATIEGIVGLLFFGLFLGGVLVMGFRAARKDTLAAHMTTFIACYLVFCLLNTNFYSTANNSLLFGAIGLLAARVAVSSEAG